MNAPASDASSGDARLNEIIAAYLEAVDRGREPDRQALLQHHPEFAAELEAFFADREAFDRLKPTTPPHDPADAPTLAPSESPPAAGIKVRYFGDYELLEEIAQGGMGRVYKARQVSLNRLVALKMILAGQLASEADVKRFHAEAEAVAQLDHPSIVPIYEVGEFEGSHYYAMQFIDGPSLAKHLTQASCSNRDAAELVRACAEAVQYAHERGVVHRDLKPGNVLLLRTDKETKSDKETGRQGDKETEDTAPFSLSPCLPVSVSPYLPVSLSPKITDFGLAKRMGHGTSLTAPGQIVGTPSYMAPEQASSKKDVGPAADVYALGAILYELITSRPPFQAATPLDTVLQVVTEEPTPPSQVQPKVPRDLETICLKCLEKQPDRRYDSARELAEDLGRFLEYEPIHARPASRTRRLGVWVRKRPWAVVGLALAVILAVSLLAQAFYLESRRQNLESLFREGQVSRMSLALQTAPDGPADGPLRPTAEHALQSLRKAAALRPEGRLYEEALDVLLVEHRGGERIYPKPGAKPQLPRDEKQFPAVFTLTQDAKQLMLGGRLIDTTHGNITSMEGPVPLRTACDPTGHLLGRRTASMAVEILERATGKVRARIDPPSQKIWTYVFSPDGRWLAAVTGVAEKDFSKWQTRAIEIWDVSAGRHKLSIPLPAKEEPTKPSFSGNGRWLAWVASSEVRVYAVATGEQTSRIPAPAVGAAGLSPDGTELAWANHYSSIEGANVNVASVATGEPIHELRCTGPVAVVHLAYTPDGQFIVGQTGFQERDVIFSSFGRGDPNQAAIFQEHTNRVQLWDAANGNLVAWLRGHAFADGFGSQNELAVARTRGSGSDADLEIDLWWPAELLRAIEQEGLAGWEQFSQQEPQGNWLGFTLLFSLALLLPTAWLSITVKSIEQKRITTRTAHIGIVLTLLLIVAGVYGFMTAVAELSGHWERLWRLDVRYVFGILYGLAGLLGFLMASVTGPLALKCYTHATYGEVVEFFERLQAFPEETNRQLDKRTRLTYLWLWWLGFTLVFWGMSYLDGSMLLNMAAMKWKEGLGSAFLGLGLLITPGVGFFMASLIVLALFYVIMALAEAKWGPAKEPWFVLPPSMPQTEWSRSVERIYNLFPPSRTGRLAFWLVIFLAAMGLAALELYPRLTSGSWPRSLDAHFLEFHSTAVLALGVFYASLSLVRLLQIWLERPLAADYTTK